MEPSRKLNLCAGCVASTFQAYDAYPAPSPLRTDITDKNWLPSRYHSTAKADKTLSAPEVGNPLCSFPHKSSTSHLDTALQSARTALHTRYSPADWLKHNRAISADQLRASGERLRLQSHCLAAELDEKSKATVADVGMKLGDRIGDVHFWKSELGHETDAMMKEIEKLNAALKALNTFIKESEKQIQVAEECLYQREKRQGVDLVHDEPEVSMVREIELTRELQHAARGLADKAETQVRLNRAAQHELEMDTQDKQAAAIIDSAAFQLRDTSRGLALHLSVHRLDNTVSVPETWAEFTNNNIQQSQSTRTTSRKLRADMEAMLCNTGDQLWTQWNHVNTALTHRVQEAMAARNKIQHHLSLTLREIFDTERNMEILRKAIKDKQNPLKVATTRLESRLHRPNMEACRDPAQARLVQQVSEIEESVESLTTRIRSGERLLQDLLQKRSTLERDLSIKNNTLFIDNEKCLGMRRTYPLQSKTWNIG